MAAIELDLVVTIGTILTIIGLLVEHFHFQAGLQERIATLETQSKACYGLDKDVRELMTKVDLFWGALEKQIPGLLLKGNPLPSDSRVAILLSQYNTGTISPDDLPELVLLLELEANSPDHTPGELIAIILLSAAIKVKLIQEKIE